MNSFIRFLARIAQKLSSVGTALTLFTEGEKEGSNCIWGGGGYEKSQFTTTSGPSATSEQRGASVLESLTGGTALCPRARPLSVGRCVIPCAFFW